MIIPEILTAKQAAAYLQLDERTIYKLARRGEIPAVKIARGWRFKKELIDSWIRDRSNGNNGVKRS